MAAANPAVLADLAAEVARNKVGVVPGESQLGPAPKPPATNKESQ